MSIPVSIDPMGTLGANPLTGYVTDGLILCFDALLEKPGTRNFLTNWVSGTRCEFDGPLLVANGVIGSADESLIVFNDYPDIFAIDGHAPVGLDYSADVCAEQGGYLSSVVWMAEPSSGGNILGFQVHYNAEGIRVQGVQGETSSPIISYPLSDKQRVSAHVEYNNTSTLTINGESVGSVVQNRAGVDGATMALSRQPALLAYRLYNRRLTVAEQKRNYEMDKKRFNVS